MATFDLGRVTPLYKGDYSASTSYELNDVVLYNGNLYWHIQATATVGILPTDTTVWKLAFADEGVRAEIRGYADNAQASANSALASKSAAATSASQASASASQAALSAQSAQTAETGASASAQTASTKASEASTSAQSAASSAQTATDKATLATNKAQAASESASLATAKANAAATSETNAVTAAQTATAKASEASTAAATATSAKTDAVAANTAAQSAKTAAQTAQTGAETAAASVQSSAAQIATNAEDISQLKSDLNELNSNFADMQSDGAVPSAEQILSDKGVTDCVPYHYHKTGGNGADREYVDAIVGGTVCWNQLVNPDFSSSKVVNGVTYTKNVDGSISVSGESTDRSNIPVNTEEYINIVQSHKYLIAGNPSGASQSTYYMALVEYTNASYAFAQYAYTDTIINNTHSTANHARLEICGASASGVSVNVVFYPQLFDLTAMFGSTIADYIYQLEQTTAGAGVAFFKSLFPKDYYEYNSGELVSVSGLSAHVMRDVDNNIIRSYPLDSTLTLRGIPKLDAQNNLYYDGDRYLPDGKVERRYGIVDLGALSWSRNISDATGIYYFVTHASWIKLNTQLICSKYMQTWYEPNNSNMPDKSIYNRQFFAFADNVIVRDDAYADATAFKAAMSGVMLVYELATPTTETADPYQHLQQCDPNGTEEFVSTGIVPVGHNTKYPDNLRMKLDNLPWNFANLIAPTESTFTATRNYTTGALLIVNNVLYKATANIANGATITVGTNVIATTLADVIAALS